MIKAWTEEAWEDFEYWTTQDRRMLKRILQLLKDIDRNGYEGIGKPERLSGDLASYWSRRIDDANRIVYRIDGSVVKIVQCGSHYRDKSPLPQPPPGAAFCCGGVSSSGSPQQCSSHHCYPQDNKC